ncbi:MAG: hypothetical protein IH905_13125 [Proteobacteria bacterium]|nr:hypothetical protein [Pseudomonadota bacterium]
MFVDLVDGAGKLLDCRVHEASDRADVIEDVEVREIVAAQLFQFFADDLDPFQHFTQGLDMR